MFYIKWVLGRLLSPLPACLGLMLVAFIFLYLDDNQLGYGLLGLGFIFLYLLSLQPVAFALLSPLEFTYPVYSGEPIRFIHVLGSGHFEASSLPITSQLSYTSSIRVVEAVRIWHLNPNATLLLSGYTGINHIRSTAVMHQELALALGIPANNIQIFEKPRDTEEEVLTIKSIIGDESVAVVTTASHMLRTMAFYNKMELQVIPAPTMHLSRTQICGMHFSHLYPEESYLHMSATALHEWIGLLWMKLK
ncbi:ElyC/SanA/YdcF family protein [Shewanella surugensis]|uniref:YdcF family protein n=1 Tax=Shewanella surugensis TaxID=212020 RepID=A0ABT0LCN9_9GAMM|nr:ElyC/SanA/YdcF family protein [Shewanella surugensis]MCL1125444.1 YdcF family protein [Shewanella surugensis]